MAVKLISQFIKFPFRKVQLIHDRSRERIARTGFPFRKVQLILGLVRGYARYNGFPFRKVQLIQGSGAAAETREGRFHSARYN